MGYVMLRLFPPGRTLKQAVAMAKLQRIMSASSRGIALNLVSGMIRPSSSCADQVIMGRLVLYLSLRSKNTPMVS